MADHSSSVSGLIALTNISAERVRIGQRLRLAGARTIDEHRRVIGGRHSSETAQLVAAALSGPGRTGTAVREAAAGRAAALAGVRENRASDVPSELVSFVDKIARHAYTVTDSDLETLRNAGYSDDQLFEVVIAVAIGAALGRLDIGLNALREVRS